MKRSLSFSVVLVVIIASAAAAKTRPAVTVNIPFDFIVANQTLPAGSYKVQALLQSRPGAGSIEVLALRNTAGRTYRAVVADLGPEAVSEGTELRFRCYDGRAYLASVRHEQKELNLYPSVSELSMRETNSASDPVMLAVSGE